MPNNKKYSYDDLTELARQIENIKKKSLLNEIRDIIFDSNPKLNFTETSNGIYFQFHNLNQETYFKIEKFLKKNKSILEDDSTENYFDIKSTKEKDDDVDFLTGFSNREKNLIKRRLYDSAITKNSEMPENTDNINNDDDNYVTSNSSENSIQKNKKNKPVIQNIKSVFIKKNKN